MNYLYQLHKLLKYIILLFHHEKEEGKISGVVCKIKSRAIHYVLEKEEEPQLSKYFQEDETVGVYQSFDDMKLDAPEILLFADGKYEEVDPTEIILKDNPPKKEKKRKKKEKR